MKCAIITPVGPGHEALAKECQHTVLRAWEHDHGEFSAMQHLLVDDTQGRLGRSAARNNAVKDALESGAQWIFFLDADDGMLPRAFRAVAPYLAEFDAIWGNILEMAPGGTRIQPRLPQILTMQSYEELLVNDPFHTLQMGHFVRAALAASQPFDTGLDSGEDFDYYLRLWAGSRCVKVVESFFVNRRGFHSSGPRSSDGRQWRDAVDRLMTNARAAAGVSEEEQKAILAAKTQEYRDWLISRGIPRERVPNFAF